MDIFRTMIVTADDAPLAREIAASFGSGGENMWITGLSPDGLDPATHYISTGYIPGEFAHLLTDPVALYEAATAQGVDCTLEEVEALLASSDVTEEGSFVAQARLGVKIIQATE